MKLFKDVEGKYPAKPGDSVALIIFDDECRLTQGSKESRPALVSPVMSKLKRFDIPTAYGFSSVSDGEYYDDGAFVCADVAQGLYDALEYMLSVCPAIDSIGEEARQEARAALAKARGES